MPERSLLRVVRAGRITRSRPNTTIFLVNQIFITQTFPATVAPLAAHPLVQIFGEGFRQPVRKSLCHDCVVVIVLCPVAIAKLLQADAAGHRKGSDVVRQSRLFRRDEVSQGTAWVVALPV